MPSGYHGRILHVNVETGDAEVETPGEAFYRTFLGGSAMGVYFLLKRTPPGIDALDPRNVLTVAGSVVTGAPVSGTSRLTVTAKSPLTGAIGDSQCGGGFPVSFKASGIDALTITGRAPEPCYLFVHDGIAELRSAGHIWGRDTQETELAIAEEVGGLRHGTLVCGPAGERGVRFASLISGLRHAAGRTGMGAVLGSKNVKAIVASGDSRVGLADREAVLRLARKGGEAFDTSAVYGIGTYGTASIVRSQQASSGLPTRNWQSGEFEGWETLDGKHYTETILVGRHTCSACMIRCKRVVELTGDPFPVDAHFGGPEYETVAMFGSMCGVNRLETVARAHQLCNQFGMDTISCGATVSWAMDCFSRGILTLDDTGGMDLSFGNDAAVLELTRMIALREGLGDLLAEGSARAAQSIGGGSERLLSTVKGQEMPAHMPDAKPSLGLIYAVNPFGPDHESSSHDPTYATYPERMAQLGLIVPQPARCLNIEKVEFARVTGQFYACLDSLAVCAFTFGPAWQLYGPRDLVDLVRAATGWDMDLAEMMRCGERRIVLMRVYNLREGLTPAQDHLPPVLLSAQQVGQVDGSGNGLENFGEAKRYYYQQSELDPDSGEPEDGVYRRLGLEWARESLVAGA